jgi:CBS domain-containing protein
MAANNIGALAVVEQHGDTEIIGIFSERDYLHKIAALNRDHAKTTIREVATIGATDLVIVEHDELIEGCMKKMLSRGIRHLLVRQDKLVTGMISVKDVVVCAHLKETAMGTHLKETDNRRPCMAIS